MTETLPKFVFEDDPDLPGWKRWWLPDPERYNAFLGPLSVKVEGEIARVRMIPKTVHSNLRGHVHGGALLGFIDVALFAAARAFGSLSAGVASTLDLSTQFIAGGDPEQPIEARIELLRETGRLIFLRGLVVQGEVIVASFTGTLRKSASGGAS